MYNPKAHSALVTSLQVIEDSTDEAFRLRYISQFHELYRLYGMLYGHTAQFDQHLINLVQLLAKYSGKRPPALKKMDRQREREPGWFLSEKLAGMMLYTDRFNDNLQGITEKISYFRELGVNLIHLMPLFASPERNNDGGYAVSDFKKVDPKFGTAKDLKELTDELHREGMYLMLDLVVNHTAEDHEWARKARAGDPKFQNFYYTFRDRTIPDLFEQCLPEIFPENAPGNFTWNEDMKRYVMTVFHHYQWDLNYTNPEVFHVMLDILLYHANKGVDIFRLDAVAFLWKRLQTNSQNLPEVHVLLKLFKICAKIVAPGVVFLAEAIVSPKEIIPYFGESDVWSDECDIAYNASLMALLWDALSTRDAKVLHTALNDLPPKPKGTTWINYLRCHDDIGLGYDNRYIEWAGYTPHLHRSFQLEFYTGNYQNSFARGLPFMVNPKTGDARISGSLASLAGLEAALEAGNPAEIETSINRILMLHGIMIAYDGIPMLYYGDELATVNAYDFMDDPEKKADNRWVHRPVINWKKARKRKTKGNVEYQVFRGIKHLLTVRKLHRAFADNGEVKLQQTGNAHLIVFSKGMESVLVLGNISEQVQHCPVTILHQNGLLPGQCRDLLTDDRPRMEPEGILLKPYQVMWLS